MLHLEQVAGHYGRLGQGICVCAWQCSTRNGEVYVRGVCANDQDSLVTSVTFVSGTSLSPTTRNDALSFT